MAAADRLRLVWTPLLKKQGRQTLQAVGLTFPKSKRIDGEVTLRIGERMHSARVADLLEYPRSIPFSGSPGRLWMIPRPARPVKCTAEWKTPSGRLQRAELNLKPAHPAQIHLMVCATAESGPASGNLMKGILDGLDAAARSSARHRTICTLSTPFLQQMLEDGLETQNRARLEQHIRQGRISWGLAPFTVHSELMGAEEMYRSFYGARDLAARFDRPVPASAMMNGVPAHTAALGMALVAAGCKILQIGSEEALRPAGLPSLFWWKLPNSLRLLVHYHAPQGTSLLPPEDWPWQEWPAVLNIGSETAPTTGWTGELDWIDKHFDSPRCRIGTAEDFANAIIRKHGESLPLVAGEMTDWQVAAIAGQTRAAAWVRRDQDRLPSLETLQTLANWHAGSQPDAQPDGEIRTSFEQMTLFNQAGAVDKSELAGRAHAQVDSLEVRTGARVASALGRASGPALVLFNTLSWPRGGVVRVGAAALPAGEFELVDASTGGVVAYERSADGIEFVAPSVPACGYLALDLKSVEHRGRSGQHADWEERKLTVHTNENTLQFHEKGGLARWHDRRHSVQWCSGEAEHPTGAYLYEMPAGKRLRAFARQVHDRAGANVADAVQFGPLPAGPARICPEITPVYSRVVVEADIPARRPPGRRSGNARRCALTYTLYRGRPEVYVNLRLFDKAAVDTVEAGYAHFSFAIEKPYVLVDRIAHLVTPADDLMKGMNAGYMAVHHGVRMEGDHAGMNFYPLDTPLISFGAPGGCHFDEQGAYLRADLYATLFSHANGFKPLPAQSGDFSFNFVMHPTGNDGWDGGLTKKGLEHFRPLLPVVVDRRPPSPAMSLLKIDPPDVQLVTLKPAHFERGYVLRLWNVRLDPTDARIDLPAARRGDQLWMCDGLERPLRRIALRPDGRARVKLRPHEAVTLLLRSV